MMDEQYKSEVLDQVRRMTSLDGTAPYWLKVGLFIVWAIPAGLYAVLSGKTKEFSSALEEAKQ